MSIKIAEINFKSLGPLKEFSEELSQVNLIYGKNEQGKTFLVEFILRSLFRNLKTFNLRTGDQSGNVVVSGLGEEPQRFSPGSGDKLEDYLQAIKPGLPANLARLLVVKGAELDLNDKPGTAISKTVIKSFLSSQTILDKIQEVIPRAVQSASIESGSIIGSNIGELKKRNQLLQHLSGLDDLLDRVNLEFSGGQLSALKHQQSKLREKRILYLNAKRFYAWTLSQRIRKVQSKINDFEEKKLDQLLETLNEFEALQRDLEIRKEKHKKALEKSLHYDWLIQATNDYERLLERGGEIPDNRMVVLAGVLIALGLILFVSGLIVSLVQQQMQPGMIFSIVGMLPLLAGILVGTLQIRKGRKIQSFQVGSQELERISTSFEERFGKPLTGITTLKTISQAMQEDYFTAKTLKEEIQEKQSRLDQLKAEISSSVSLFGFKGQKAHNPNTIAEQLKQERYDLNELEKELTIKLAGLLVDPVDYLDSDPGCEYSSEFLKEIEEQIINIEQTIQIEEMQLQTLMTEIKAEIKCKEQISWEDAIGQLRLARLSASEEYSTQTSRILASIILKDVIEHARLQEDENIRSNLSSPYVINPLKKITGHYNSVRMDGDILKVADKFNEYSLDELSTGAGEQVLLALRIGLASRLLGHDSAFLILDDAFQHSDWNRRVNLVEETIELAKNGWQILYLSMDDHIKHLFDEFGKKRIPGLYRSFDLCNDSKFDGKVNELKI